MGQLLFVTFSAGAGAGNLQATYDVGPTGLIVTDATGPVGVDALRFENEVISSTDGTSGDGSGIELSAGDGGIAAPISPDGGPITLGAGNGSNAAGGGNTAGNGGEVSILAGSPGTASGGATAGIGGPVNITAGLGGGGTGGFVSITSGSGTTASGDLDINTADSAGVVGTLSVIGGAGTGAADGGPVVITAGAGADAGGALTVTAGAGTTGNGGDLSIVAGASTGLTGGTINVTGGQGNALGGSIFINGGPGQTGGDFLATAGAASGGGDGGNATVSAGDSDSSAGGQAALLGGTGLTGGEARISSGQGTTAADAGLVRISLRHGISNTSGGLTVTPTDNHVTLRTYPTDDVINTGSLIVHVLDEDGENAQTFEPGMVHFREEQGAAVDIRVGFRASKQAGVIGLLARVYSLPFANADLIGAVLTVTHNLGTAYPLVQIYDNSNANVPIGLNVISIVATSINVTTITFGAPVLPLTGTWGVTIVGI